jgi:CrcB protein
MRRARDARPDDARSHLDPALLPGGPHIIDPDVDLHDPAQRAETRPREWDLLVAMAVGGVVGAEARYGLSAAVPHADDAIPWATVLINASGCLLIGALMVVLLELARPHRLWRPFLGVGVLGGYTTYSTFAVDAVRLIEQHRPGLALGYVVTTFAACLVAVWFGTVGTRVMAGRSRSAAPDDEVEAARR